MASRLLALWLFVFVLLGGGLSVYAADETPTQQAPSTQNQEKPDNPSNSNQEKSSNPSDSSGGGLNIQPIAPGDTVIKMKKMEGDIQHLGEGLAPSLSKYAIVAGVIMLVFGTIFRKLLKAGVFMLGISVVVYFLLGDMNRTSVVLKKIVATLQSYL